MKLYIRILPVSKLDKTSHLFDKRIYEDLYGKFLHYNQKNEFSDGLHPYRNRPMAYNK